MILNCWNLFSSRSHSFYLYSVFIISILKIKYKETTIKIIKNEWATTFIWVIKEDGYVLIYCHMQALLSNYHIILIVQWKYYNDKLPFMRPKINVRIDDLFVSIRSMNTYGKQIWINSMESRLHYDPIREWQYEYSWQRVIYHIMVSQWWHCKYCNFINIQSYSYTYHE